jgi:hypothetical protein
MLRSIGRSISVAGAIIPPAPTTATGNGTGRAARRGEIELLQHGRLCETAGDFRKRYMPGGRQMTADRRRITSGGKSALRHFALAVVCAALVAPSMSAEAADLVVW